MNWYQRKIGRKLRSFKKSPKHEETKENTHEVITFEKVAEPKIEKLVPNLPIVEPRMRSTSEYYLPSAKITGSRCVLSSSAGK